VTEALDTQDPSSRDLGLAAEQRAARALEEAGYLIIETNWVLRAEPVGDGDDDDRGCDQKPRRQGRAIGELDVVAWHGGAGQTLCFIEVRSRANADHGHAAEMIDRGKRARVSRMAGAYLHEKGRELRAEAYRFDAVAITGDVVDIIQDAWRLGIPT